MMLKHLYNKFLHTKLLNIVSKKQNPLPFKISNLK